jgi:DNA-binding response OmpR family regulator
MTVEKKHKILLVDDDENLLITLTDFLEMEGFEVITASSGEDALKVLAKVTPGLMILDVNMPGMGGIGVLKKLSQMTDIAKPPVYMFTARSNMESFFEGLDVAGFMPKPCDPDDLLREIRGVLGADAGPVSDKNGASGVKVLLAEDEAGKRKGIERALKLAGFEVVAVASGPEVVERAIVEKPQVVLLKLVMEKMNGDAAASMLSGIPTTRGIPAVLYDDTGFTPRRDAMKEEQGVGARVFCNTTDPADLVKAVERVSAGRK